MYEKEITQILEKLDDSERKQVLDFAEFINYKHANGLNKNIIPEENPLLQIAGFAEFEKMSSTDIDKELY